MLANLFVDLIDFVGWLLSLYVWIVIVNALFTWLILLRVLNQHNRFVDVAGHALHAITEPVMWRIRRYMPMPGGVDLSPFALLIIVVFIKRVLLDNLKDMVGG